MRFSPAGDPGTPDARSATRYLVWLAGRHPFIFGSGLALGVAWMLSQALMPAALGRAIGGRRRGAPGRGRPRDVGPGAARSGPGPGGRRGHAPPVRRLQLARRAYRTVQVTVAAANRLGATLPRRVATGEVVSIGTSDVEHIGNAMDIPPAAPARSSPSSPSPSSCSAPRCRWAWSCWSACRC